MSDYPLQVDDSDQAYGIMSVAGSGSPVAEAVANSGLTWQTSGAQAWPTANLALFMPVVARKKYDIPAMAWFNGGTVSGNLDAGVYDRNGARMGHTASVAQTGSGAFQSAAISGGSISIVPGLYYLALAFDNTTATMVRTLIAAAVLQACGMQQMASAFPLPSTATFANPANGVTFMVAAQIGPTI